jgi:predicted signal transduction protein with EAL and GGDEF domain
MTLDLSLGEHDGVELLRLVADCKLYAMPIVIISGCEERILNSTKRVAEGLDLADTLPDQASQHRQPARRSLAARTWPHRFRAGPVPEIDRERIAAGLVRDEFYVEFQPKIDLGSGRWSEPRRSPAGAAEFGNISPAVFIPLIEKFGLMPDLTNYVLSSAIAGSRTLIERHPGFTVAVNVSGSLMTDLMLPERIEGILRKEGVAPGSLIVEVTESIGMSDVDRAMDILVRLRIKGVGAAIDDFGTGFSSLAALARLRSAS